MKSIIEKYKWTSVWHFTDSSNVPSIRKHGLLSYAEVGRRPKVRISHPGGNYLSHKLDKKKGLDEYVHLAFACKHAMLNYVTARGKIPNPVWLEFDSSIILGDGVLFCPAVANATSAIRINAEDAKEKIDFESILAGNPWKNEKLGPVCYDPLKAEILIPNSIPANKIIGYKNG